jgi:sugar phosphate isomerase/epimerase
MDLSVTRSTLNKKLPYAEMVRAAHRVGFRYVELSAAKWRVALEEDPALAKLIGPHGVQPWHAGWNLRLNWDTARFAGALVEAPAAMDLTAGLGSRSGTLVLPHYETGGAPIPGLAEIQDRIGAVADLAAERGLKVCVEYMGLRPQDPPEYGVRTLPGTLRVLRQVGRSNVGVLIDSYHWHISGAPDLGQIPAGMAMWVHLNDAPAGMPVRRLRDCHRVLPGQGVIDLTGLLTALHARGYDGSASVEVKHPELHALPGEQAAKRAFDAGYAVLRRAGLAQVDVEGRKR